MPEWDQKRELELVERYAAKLEEDLAYAAPEMWRAHIQERMEQLLDDLLYPWRVE